MKRIFLITTLILGLAAAYGFAQMGGGMMGGEKGHGSMMGEKKGESGQGMMEHKGMMKHEDMTSGMTDMMHQMSEMMHDMGEKMGDMPKDKMHSMSGMMKDMCSEMTKMSVMMDTGMATDKDMNAMHERMTEMQKKMSEIK